MNQIYKGFIAGIIFGVVSIVPMLFMAFDNKWLAIAASFISRFSIGFIIFNLKLPLPGLLKGALVGLLISLPSALVTGEYGPILGLGVVGGIVCGYFDK